MDDNFIHLLMAIEEEANFNRANLRNQNRHLRDTSDPFNLPEKNFIKLFRLTPQLARNLCDVLSPHLLESERVTAIPAVLKVLSALFFYAHGSYQKSVGTSYLFGLSQSSVSRCINIVSNAFHTHLLHTWVKFPTTIQEKQGIKLGFHERFDFSGVIGAIDCTHVAVVAPPAEDEQFPGRVYINRKSYHSINVQIVCDAELKLLAVNARYPGSVHDAAIWRTSIIYQHLRQQYAEGERSSWLIGDSGYPLQPWLFTPIIGAVPDTPQGRYNARLTSARNAVERCIGVLKLRFRCLLRHRTLHYDPISAGKIIYACSVLHNICVQNNVPQPDPLNGHEEILINVNEARVEEFENWLNEGLIIRDNFIANNFN